MALNWDRKECETESTQAKRADAKIWETKKAGRREMDRDGSWL